MVLPVITPLFILAVLYLSVIKSCLYYSCTVSDRGKSCLYYGCTAPVLIKSCLYYGCTASVLIKSCLYYGCTAPVLIKSCLYYGCTVPVPVKSCLRYGCTVSLRAKSSLYYGRCFFSVPRHRSGRRVVVRPLWQRRQPLVPDVDPGIRRHGHAAGLRTPLRLPKCWYSPALR